MYKLHGAPAPALSCLRQQLGESENPSKKHICYLEGTDIQPIDANRTEQSEFDSKALEYRVKEYSFHQGGTGPSAPTAGMELDHVLPAGPVQPWGW